MNRAKRRFRWLDVLKPEGAYLAALALALDDDKSDPLLTKKELSALSEVLQRRAQDGVKHGFLAGDAEPVIARDQEGYLAIPLGRFRHILKDLMDARRFRSESHRDACRRADDVAERCWGRGRPTRCTPRRCARAAAKR